jgi:hypothetical protein
MFTKRLILSLIRPTTLTSHSLPLNASKQLSNAAGDKAASSKWQELVKKDPSYLTRVKADTPGWVRESLVKGYLNLREDEFIHYHVNSKGDVETWYEYLSKEANDKLNAKREK